MVQACIDGNEAAAMVAYACSEAIAIYPITPASPMGELADAWAAEGRPNLWGVTPSVVEMQAEGGAAGALHGMATKGALATTFTASQGLLLMAPNLFKLAGELTPTVVHVAARSVATHALSIFGDHSDVMAVRPTGMTMLVSADVQEAHDLAAVAHAATLASRVPVLHFFDGFRTSHELARIELLGDDDLRALIDDDDVVAHRLRGLSPDRPVLRGTAQNPDVFFQAREAANPHHAAVAGHVQRAMDVVGDRTGRRYGLVSWYGAADADRAIVLMGSGVGAAREVVAAMTAAGERVGLLQIRLFRPFPTDAVLDALPDTVTSMAVLDRTKEPGAVADPLHLDVTTTLADAVASGRRSTLPRIIGGRYGLSSKEFTPAMVKGVFDELAATSPRSRITVGIVDDVTGLSVDPDPSFRITRRQGDVQAVFYGLGSDGTVGANKNSVKIVGEHTDRYAQGYFVYDSKKSGAMTVSHLRFSDQPITSTYLIDEANFVACHQFGFLERLEVLDRAAHGAVFLLNAPYGPDEVWSRLPVEVQQTILDKGLHLWVIDAHRVARDVGLGGRINTVMQPCFFALSGILPREQAVAAVKDAIERTYAKRGREVVDRNLAAVDRALEELHEVERPGSVEGDRHRRDPVDGEVDDFVRRFTARLLAGQGDALPVSAMPVDGTFPTGTARYERRAIAQDLPIWDPGLCIDCGKCAIVCPHAAIRVKAYEADALDGAPAGFKSKPFGSKQLRDHQFTVQVAPDDCTGCGVCVDVCPAFDKSEVSRRAITMQPAAEHRAAERPNWEHFVAIEELDRTAVRHDDVRHGQLLQPLFEFSGACAGCGETPYLKLLTQLFGDRMVVANATGCSSIFGGNLPTTPWASNRDGRGPAWSNSLFEDNAEFGLGMRVALEQQQAAARTLLRQLAGDLGDDLVTEILEADQRDERGVLEQRGRVAALRERLAEIDSSRARLLASISDTLVRTSTWIIGGDGWAYDIGFGGLDHVLASGRDVNILVLDTEVYSNTGGQASKATFRGAVAKFAMAGKATPKKDLGLLATQYGDVYVAQVAMGANDRQVITALREADEWPGPSLVLAYSTCIAHGIDMTKSMQHQRDAVRSGYWPLYRYHPGLGEHEHPFRLDSRPPSLSMREFAASEGRFAMLMRSDPERAERLLALAQADIDERWRYYGQLTEVERTIPHETDEGDADPTTDRHARSDA